MTNFNNSTENLTIIDYKFIAAFAVALNLFCLTVAYVFPYLLTIQTAYYASK